MGTSAFWIVVECACRILGVSTAAVLCAVGVKTLRQGEFHNLGVYLLVSAGGMLVFELSFFTDVLLMWCLPCPPKWKAFVLWKKLATLGGFQKFLYYTLMSVVCFLHPVLLWHAVIPGTMLLVTGVAYFILSKKQQPPAAKERAGAGARYEDASAVTSDAGEQTYSFFRVTPGNRTSALSLVPSAAGGGGARAVEENSPPAGIRGGRQVRFREDQAETQECPDAETTSDKAPMIPP